MAEGSGNVGGAGSTRVGGAHIDLTLKGAEQVKAQAADVAQTVTGKFVPAMKEADAATEKVGKSSEKAAEGLAGFSNKGLAGMLLKVAALRKAMMELSDVLEVIRVASISGGDAASKIFSEQGLAGAESRLKAIADHTARTSSALANASDVLKNIATLDISGLVGMFTEPAKLMDEQNRLALLAGKQMRADREKEREKDKEAADARSAQSRYDRLMEEVAEGERIKREEEAYNRQLQREREAEAEALERHRERGREMAKAFEEEMNRVMDGITDRIQGGVFGVTQAGGDMSAVLSVLNRIDRKTEKP